MKTALAAPVALLLALILGGCSDDGSDPQEGATSLSPSEPATSAAATTGVISPVDLPADPAFSGEARGVIDDVEMTTCDTEPGQVEARGSATNSATSRRDVAVSVSWTVGATGDVVAKGVAVLDDLAPGATRSWVVRTTVPGSTTTACVPSAQAGQLKG